MIFILNFNELTLLAILTLFSAFLPLVSKGGGINDGTYLKESKRETFWTQLFYRTSLQNNFWECEFVNENISVILTARISQNARCKTDFCKHQKDSSNKCLSVF